MFDLIDRTRDRIARRLLPSGACVGYSQCGEDLIIRHLFAALLGVTRPTYLDIGANDPQALNNTYLFYRGGGRGVLVEPDPVLCDRIRRVRPHDVCLNVGIADQPVGAADFFVFDPPVFNTFSATEAQGFRARGYRMVSQTSVPLFDVNRVIRDHCARTPDLLSLDAEGFDERILTSLDTARTRPKVMCVETVDHDTQEKSDRILSLLGGRDYVVYADTYVNTVFVDAAVWSGAKLRWRRDRPHA
jgi:FkbM family methyltransferase